MNTKKSLLAAAVVASVGIGAATVPTLVSAETTSSAGHSSIVDKLAQKFNLKKDEVQAVFDEDKAAHKAEMEKKFSDNLQKAVDEGKITAEQKTLIENKLKEFRAARQAEMEELHEWAEQNNLNGKFLIMGHKAGNNHLEQLVDDGTITAEQKTLIENKQAELKEKREVAHEALEKWAEENNIDKTYLKNADGPGHKMMIKHF